MIRRKPKSLPSTYLTPPPEDLPSHQAAVISDWDADDEGTMSAEDLNASPPTSLDEQPNGPYFPSRPTLSDVLSNTSPPPWTLSAFTAYLSQNHCLENLEFTMDAERYRDRYRTVAGQMNGKAMNVDSKECNYIRMLWKRLMDAYIVQDGPREINIPSDVRESLLSLPNHTAPPPSDELDSAAKIIYDLMEESVLVSFLNEVPVATSIESSSANGNYFLENTRQSSSRIRRAVSSRERKPTRSRSRRRASPSSSSLEIQGSPSDRQATSSTTLISTKTKRSRAQSHLSSDSGEVSLTNDSTSASSPGHEPMTPPNTPPGSDIGGSSPRNRGDHTWKKMLVWKKKSSQGMRDSRFPTLED